MMSADPSPLPNMKVVDPMQQIRLLVAYVARWLKAEPVAARAAGALVLTALAKYGVHLDANATLLVAAVLSSIAAGSARTKVTPSHKIPVKKARVRQKESGAGEILIVLVTVVATILVLMVLGVDVVPNR